MFVEKDFLEKVLWVLGIVEICAGIVLCVILLPDTSSNVYTPSAYMYIVPIGYFFVGLASGLVFLAISNILFYLRMNVEYRETSNRHIRVASGERTLRGATANTRKLDINDVGLPDKYKKIGKAKFERIKNNSTEPKFSKLLDKYYVICDDVYVINDTVHEVDLDDLVEYFKYKLK